MNEIPDSNESHESRLIPLVDAARGGSDEIQNQLMAQLRTYFHLMSQHELGAELKRKIDNSDIVQQSCVKVIEGIDDFRGTSEGELRNWLKRILVNEVNQAGRGYLAQKRDLRREVSVDADSRLGVPGGTPVDSMMTPRTSALSEERAAQVHKAISQLPDDYQHVIDLRNWQGLTFPQIAQRIDKSINATEKLWYRAIQRLRKELGDDDE